MKDILNKKKFLIKTIVALIIVIGSTIFAKYDYFLYKDTIATVKQVENIKTSDGNEEREENYNQILKLKIRNGKHKGEYVEVTNKYFYSQFNSTKYSKGNDIFISISEEDGLTGKILRSKVDIYAVFVTSIFVVLVLMIAGRKGVLVLLTMVVNIVIYVFALKKYIKSEDIELTTCIITFCFIVLTLMILNGFSRKSFGAIISSIITVCIIYFIYLIAYKYSSRPSFELMNYIFGNENLDALFLSSVILGSLGAVMDVSITINSSVSEIVNTAKNPSIKALIKSVKEISYDIMGTMVNVLFFLYI